MKLICKCENIEDIESDSLLESFRIRNIDDGTLALVCKSCNEVVYININN